MTSYLSGFPAVRETIERVRKPADGAQHLSGVTSVRVDP